MSLFDFPPLNTTGRPYAIQEYSGEIITGSEEEFLAVNKCRLLLDYPSIDKIQLSGLRHCISKDNMKNVFANGDSTWNQLTNEGITGVVKKVTEAAEPTKLWPLAKIGRGVLKVQNGVALIASKMLPIKGQDKMEEIIESYGTTINWKSNWIRCVSIHPTGSRLAICQPDDYIRVFPIGAKESKLPITLKHEEQRNVSCMEWEPHDQRVLAVAAGGLVIIWKIAAKTMNIRPSGQCVKLIPTNLCTITHFIWDKFSTRGLLVASCDSNKITAIDTTSEEIEQLGTSWTWGAGVVTRLVPTEDGSRIAALSTGNVLRVYDRLTWECQRFSGLKGRVLDAVWSPNSETLLFVTENSLHLQSLSFTKADASPFDDKSEKKFIASGPIQELFDLSPVEFDSSEAELAGGKERPILEIGGKVHRLALSPDGKRLAISFRKNTGIIATFSIEWGYFKITPCGLIEAPSFGSASIISFLPKFGEGSLLSIIWSDGYAQYLPFIYSENSSMMMITRNILDEISMRASACSNPHRRSISDSLRSDTLPSGILDRTEEPEEELMTERIKKNRPVL